MNSQYDLRIADGLNTALQELRGFWKLWSACLLRKCGVPTLAGIIVARLSPAWSEDIDRFLNAIGARAALIRHDKRPEFAPHPRGGFLVSASMLDETVRFFLDLDRVVAVYEPADPLLNGYNANLLFESESEVTIEIVGSGFDASDLQRGDLSPHETLSARLSSGGSVRELNLVQRVDAAAYKESVLLRKRKLQQKFESAPNPALARRIREDLNIPDDLDDHLRAIKSPLVAAERYEPISEHLVSETVALIVESDVINAYRQMTGVSFPLNFSTSFIDHGMRQVFWDIVSPQLKFQGLTEQR